MWSFFSLIYWHCPWGPARAAACSVLGYECPKNWCFVSVMETVFLMAFISQLLAHPSLKLPHRHCPGILAESKLCGYPVRLSGSHYIFSCIFLLLFFQHYWYFFHIPITTISWAELFLVPLPTFPMQWFPPGNGRSAVAMVLMLCWSPAVGQTPASVLTGALHRLLRALSQDILVWCAGAYCTV